MDSVTVLLHRLGVAYTAIMNPVFRVRRDPAGGLLRRAPRRRDPTPRATASTRPGSTSQLSPTADPKAVAEAVELLPNVLGRRPAGGRRLGRAERHAGRSGQPRWTPTARATSRRMTAATSRRCCAGSPTATSCCWATSAARCSDGEADRRPDQPARRAAAAHRRAAAADGARTTCWCWRRRPCRASCATAPTRTSWWSARTIARRGRRPSSTGSSGCSPWPRSNANVLEIPLISRRVHEALALSHGDTSHPGQLMLDIIQTIPRSELFALSAQRTAGHGQGGGRPRLAAAHAAVPAGRPARRTSCPAWCTCRATATPPWSGWRCRTSWSASSAARASSTPPGSANHPGR